LGIDHQRHRTWRSDGTFDRRGWTFTKSSSQDGAVSSETGAGTLMLRANKTGYFGRDQRYSAGRPSPSRATPRLGQKRWRQRCSRHGRASPAPSCNFAVQQIAATNLNVTGAESRPSTGHHCIRQAPAAMAQCPAGANNTWAGLHLTQQAPASINANALLLVHVRDFGDVPTICRQRPSIKRTHSRSRNSPPAGAGLITDKQEACERKRFGAVIPGRYLYDHPRGVDG